MESIFGKATPTEPVPNFTRGDIFKQGNLDKQSRYMKSWRK